MYAPPSGTLAEVLKQISEPGVLEASAAAAAAARAAAAEAEGGGREQRARQAWGAEG